MESIQELLKLKVADAVARAQEGEPSTIRLHATISAVEVVGQKEPMVDVQLSVQADGRQVLRRVAISAGAGVDELWKALTEATDSAMCDHVAGIREEAKLRAEKAERLEAARVSRLAEAAAAEAAERVRAEEAARAEG